MKTVILVYSFTGHSRAYAQKLAAKEGAPLADILETRRRGKLSAFTAGCLGALHGKPAKIQPVSADLTAVDRVILVGPVWAGRAAPALTAAAMLVPPGKTVELVLLSASGESAGAAGNIEKILADKGCTFSAREIKG